MRVLKDEDGRGTEAPPSQAEWQEGAGSLLLLGYGGLTNEQIRQGAEKLVTAFQEEVQARRVLLSRPSFIPNLFPQHAENGSALVPENGPSK
jgi:hypothetical protein